MVNEAITTALDAKPRGAKMGLAQAVGVTPATITKWVQGHTSPDPDKWTAIEQFLEMQPGDLRVAAGLPRSGGMPATTADGRWLFGEDRGDGSGLAYYPPEQIKELLLELLAPLSDKEADRVIAETLADLETRRASARGDRPGPDQDHRS